MLIDRRGFLKSLGAVSGGGLLASCGAPAERMAAYLEAPPELEPGIAVHYCTVCRACPAGCGLLVRVREGRPVKLEGNPLHPINRGALCSRGQASIQQLYGRDRLRTPRIRRRGALVEASWGEALSLVAGQLKTARAPALISGLEAGTWDDLVRDLTTASPGLQWLVHEPVALRSLTAATGLLIGTPELPRIDLSAADFVLALATDFLDAWVSPVELSRQWAERHAFGAGRNLDLEYCGPRRNLTANAADRWQRAAPARLGALALGLLHGLLDAGRPGLDENVRQQVRALAGQLGPRPALTSDETRSVARWVKRLQSATCGTVLYGGAEGLTRNATAIQCAALLTNALTGALGKNLRLGEQLALGRVSGEQRVLDAIDGAASGRCDLLLLHGCDPAYTIPGAAARLASAKLVVALASEVNETTEAAQVVLPVHHPLESWGDFQVRRGVSGLMQPVRRPLHATRHVGDLLIELWRRAGKPLPRENYRDYVVAHWADPAALGHAASAPNWDDALVAGGLFVDPAPAVAQPVLRSDAKLPALDLGRAETGLTLIAPLANALYDGRGASADLLHEVPDALLETAWEVPVELPAEFARSKGIASGDQVKLHSRQGDLIGTACVVADLEPSTIALRFGGGNAAGRDRNQAAVGQLLGPVFDADSGELALVQGPIDVVRQAGGELLCVAGSTETSERLLALAVPLSDARANRFPHLTRQGDQRGEVHPDSLPLMPNQEPGGVRPDDNLVELQQHPEHRWGMIVDLDRCTGCSACAVACYAENNVPVVGRGEMLRGRELAWLRIERHDVTEASRRAVRFLPVMCQQCDQAPCETVCPVFASYHTKDGLNGQVYNRCIGTRYCANNCPYKVRRFNYFDYRWERPENQRLNPDVTVRSRGVMEKCTFCVQRIREAGNRARAEGRPLRDGEIVPACAQTCPTRAIVFGDYRDPKSELCRLAADPRGYRLLDYAVNTRPGVVYLRRVEASSEET